MCGRVKLDGDLSKIKVAFRVPLEYPTPNFAPSWNVAPTDSLPIVRYDAKAGHRGLRSIEEGNCGRHREHAGDIRRRLDDGGSCHHRFSSYRDGAEEAAVPVGKVSALANSKG